MYLIPKVSEIRTRRLDAGLSQHSLSRTAGLGGQAINRIESGETSSVHPLRAREIAKALGKLLAVQPGLVRREDSFRLQLLFDLRPFCLLALGHAFLLFGCHIASSFPGLRRFQAAAA